jgi:hypothetical protein
LQTAHAEQTARGSEIDPFWTLTGYFNAVRELAGARALCGQDIPERIEKLDTTNYRQIPEDGIYELSSRTDSTDLPAMLDVLNRPAPDAADVLLTTSVFGTGVDISRLGLMVVNGQPKTTSAYIQSTGRVGRNRGALVVTFLRASRPRDLNHYEFFNGYHRQLHRFVEPITVMPFSMGALNRAAGPAGVGILRNMRQTTADWYMKESAQIMKDVRQQSPEVKLLPEIFGQRLDSQPKLRRPPKDAVVRNIDSGLDRWQQTARTHGDALRYVEYTDATAPVVLGDAAHLHAKQETVYENAPQSLRDIEETTGFET